MMKRLALQLKRSPFVRGLALVVVLLCLTQPYSVGGQQDFEGQPIAQIEFQGNDSLAEDTLLFYLGLEIGQPLDQRQLNASIRELWTTELIDDVRVEAFSQGSDGVRLVITVTERQVLRSVEYVGLKRLNRTDIEERIAADRIQVYEGAPVRLGELRRLETSIEEMYREQGYRFADASYVLEAATTTEKRVIFTIDEGNRVRIEDIRFEGNTVFPDWRLGLVMKETKESNLVWRLAKKDIYNPARLQEDLENIREAYRKQGYKNITIGEPVIEVRALRPNAADPEDQRRRMFVTIPIEEGERWKFGEVTIEGNDKYTDSQLLRAFEIGSGDWLRSKKVDEAVTAIDDIYKNTGYIGARVEPELVEREDRVADLVVHVYEGDQFRIGRIDIEGNTRTMDKVLRRELQVQEGLVLSLRSVQNSLLKIRQLGYFDVDAEEPVQIVNVDEENNTIDLIIKGEEADRTELQFGGGWSEVDGFFGQISLRTKNFMGRGESLGFSYQSGRFRDYLDLSYFVPWFLDRRQSIGVQLFRRDEDFDLLTTQELERERTGGSVTYGRNFGLFSSISLTGTYAEFVDRSSFQDFERDENGELILDDEGNPTPLTISSELEFINASLRPAYLYNSIDSPFEPTRGQRFQLSAEVASSALGGTQDYVEGQFAYQLFKPVTQGRIKTVFGGRVRAGYIAPYDDYELSRLDRFYLGGENSVRGFGFRTIWARDEDGNLLNDELGFPLGGDKLVQLNLEYHFVLGGPFRVVAFADAGGVFTEDQNFNEAAMRYSAGVEMRVMVPLFGAPLRFIYSQNLRPYDDDEFRSFDFTIGASF